MEPPPPSEVALHTDTQRQEAAVELGRQAVGADAEDPGSSLFRRHLDPDGRPGTVSDLGLRALFVEYHGADRYGDVHPGEASRFSLAPRAAGDRDG